MKLTRFLWNDRVRWGMIDGDDILSAGRGRGVFRDRDPKPGRPICSLAEARLLAPIDARANKIVAAAANYGERDERDGPGIFMKQPGTIIGPDEPIVYPRTCEAVIHEAELGIIIGKTARHVPADIATQYVFGYTCVNDVSASRLKTSDTGRGTSMRVKHFDTFCPVGPWIDTDLATALRGDDLRIQCRVNGRTDVDGNANDMLWGVAELVSWMSEVMTLYPGDIIASGCPGVGEIKPGDTVEVEIEGIGVLRNPVVAEKLGWRTKPAILNQVQIAASESPLPLWQRARVRVTRLRAALRAGRPRSRDAT